MRFVLPGLLFLLVAGLLWSFLAGRDAGTDRDGSLGATTGENEAPKLVGTGERGGRRRKRPSESDETGWVPPPLPDGHGPVTITVLDWEGRPLPGALVELRPRGRGFTTLKTDEKGQALFPDLPLKKRCDLVVHTWPFMETRSHREMDWAPQDITVTLERALKITGQVVDENGARATDFRVSYTLAGSKQINNVLMHEGGAFEIGDLGPGTVRVWATYKEYKRRYLTEDPPVAAGPVDVEAGTRDLVLKVARGGILHVRVKNALIDERCGPLKATLRETASGKVHVTEVDLDGHVVFLGLSPGDAHSLAIHGLGRGQYVHADDLRTSGKVQVLESRKGGRIEGAVVVPEGLNLRRATVVAENADLGTVSGFVSLTQSTYRVDGLPPDTTWAITLRGEALSARETVDLLAEASAPVGEEVALTLQETATRPR